MAETTKCCDGTGFTGNARERCTEHYDPPAFGFSDFLGDEN